MSQLKRIVNKAENCYQRLVIELRKTKGRTGVPVDVYLNTCLDCIDMVNKLPTAGKREKDKARKAIFNVYFKLKNYEGSERQTTHSFPKGKEISMEPSSMPLQSTHAYKGGLGFSGVSNALFLQNSGSKKNPYWNPPKKRAPVISVPREQWDSILAKMEQDHIDQDRLTMREFHREMEQEKREVLHEVRRLRKNSDSDIRKPLIL